MPLDPTLQDVIRTAGEARLQGVFCALPGIVQAYDLASLTADVAPAVRLPERAADGSVVQREMQVIPNVPVVFPHGRGFWLHFPLRKGDTVLLVFCDADTSLWRRTGAVSDAQDVRRHSPAYPVAIPGLMGVDDAAGEASDRDAANAVLLVPSGARLEVKKSGGSAEFVALASKVSDAMTTLKDAISNAVPMPQDGGVALQQGIVTALSAWPPDLASTSLKAD